MQLHTRLMSTTGSTCFTSLVAILKHAGISQSKRDASSALCSAVTPAGRAASQDCNTGRHLRVQSSKDASAHQRKMTAVAVESLCHSTLLQTGSAHE